MPVGPVGSLFVVKAYIALGADPAADPATWTWTDISSYLRKEGDITVTAGRKDEAARVTPGEAHLTLNNRDGRFSRHNPLGVYYGKLSLNTPIKVEIDAGLGPYAAIEMFVNEWPPRWGDMSASDFLVPIVCSGILRRLGQGEKPLHSPLYRAISTDPDLVAYWPGEDGSTATSTASGITGGPPMLWKGSMSPGGFSPPALSGTEPVLSMAADAGGADVYLRGTVAPHTATAWTVGALFYFTSIPVSTGGHYLLYWSTSETKTLTRWRMYWKDADDTLYLEAVDAEGTIVFSSAGPVVANTDLLNRWVYLYASATQNGTAVDYVWGIESTTNGVSQFDSDSGSAASQTVGAVTSVLVFNGNSSESVAAGHVFVLDRATSVAQHTPGYEATSGYAGERATDRIVRVCGEEGVTVTVQSAAVLSAQMGTQPVARFLDILGECEEADGGVIYEDGFALGWQPVAARFNAAAAMVTAHGDMGIEPQPTDDDQNLTNSVTVTRTGGSPATYTDALSVFGDPAAVPPIAGAGLYDDAVTLNLYIEDQSIQEASWRTHLGTTPGHRWPMLGYNLTNARGRLLISQWTALAFGARLTASQMPYQVTGDPADVFIEGRSERFDIFEWNIAVNASPARPYDVFTLEDSRWGHLDTDGSTLTAAVTATGTSLSVATTNAGSVLWTTSAGDRPFDIEINGERLTVTNVTGASSPQTFTVTRSVNGVAKTHAIGEAVKLWQPGVLAK